MALFGKKKIAAEKSAPQVRSVVSVRVPKDILIQPRITEKATAVSERGAYVFVVHPQATKREVSEAVARIYGVKPRKVNLTLIPRKRVDARSRGMRGFKSGGKKAYVYLKAGETIGII